MASNAAAPTPSADDGRLRLRRLDGLHNEGDVLGTGDPKQPASQAEELADALNPDSRPLQQQEGVARDGPVPMPGAYSAALARARSRKLASGTSLGDLGRRRPTLQSDEENVERPPPQNSLLRAVLIDGEYSSQSPLASTAASLPTPPAATDPAQQSPSTPPPQLAADTSGLLELIDSPRADPRANSGGDAALSSRSSAHNAGAMPLLGGTDEAPQTPPPKAGPSGARAIGEGGSVCSGQDSSGWHRSQAGETRRLKLNVEEPGARPVRREPDEQSAPPVRVSAPSLWSDDEEGSAEGKPTTSLKRENRRGSSGAAAGRGGGKRSAGSAKGGARGRRGGQSASELAQDRKKAGPCLTCLGLVFANGWLLSMVASVLLPLLYDGFPTNEVDYW